MGTWNVQKYDRTTAGEQGMTVMDIGTITFNRNGTGEKNLNYSLLGVTEKDSSPFTWTATEQQVTIDGENSDLSKTWIKMEDKNRYQKWKSTDGARTVQTLELAKE
ncbi:hypothetical protein [Maribacter sp. 2307ULW6-5]|uniref:hypothetical protein n=1 Tax=Maribacter sp. 2307ULW6-5 TaxID=3386275 RepID=UPI0039BC625F